MARTHSLDELRIRTTANTDVARAKVPCANASSSISSEEQKTPEYHVRAFRPFVHRTAPLLGLAVFALALIGLLELGFSHLPQASLDLHQSKRLNGQRPQADTHLTESLARRQESLGRLWSNHTNRPHTLARKPVQPTGTVAVTTPRRHGNWFMQNMQSYTTWQLTSTTLQMYSSDPTPAPKQPSLPNQVSPPDQNSLLGQQGITALALSQDTVPPWYTYQFSLAAKTDSSYTSYKFMSTIIRTPPFESSSIFHREHGGSYVHYNPTSTPIEPPAGARASPLYASYKYSSTLVQEPFLYSTSLPEQPLMLDQGLSPIPETRAKAVLATATRNAHPQASLISGNDHFDDASSLESGSVSLQTDPFQPDTAALVSIASEKAVEEVVDEVAAAAAAIAGVSLTPSDRSALASVLLNGKTGTAPAVTSAPHPPEFLGEEPTAPSIFSPSAIATIRSLELYTASDGGLMLAVPSLTSTLLVSNPTILTAAARYGQAKPSALSPQVVDSKILTIPTRPTSGPSVDMIPPLMPGVRNSTVPLTPLTDPANYFLYAYLPIFVAVVLRLLCNPIYRYMKLMDPFLILSRPQGALASEFMDTDYLGSDPFFAPVQAISSRRWILLATSLLCTTSQLITTLAAELTLVYPSQYAEWVPGGLLLAQGDGRSFPRSV